MEEAKQELADLKGSQEDDLDDEALYEGVKGAAAASGYVAEGGVNPSQSSVIGQKRSRDAIQDKATKQLDLRQLKRQKMLLFMNYYRGSFNGKSSSAIFYELAKQLNKITNDILWWRIVGFSDQVLHEKIDNEEKDHENL